MLAEAVAVLTRFLGALSLILEFQTCREHGARQWAGGGATDTGPCTGVASSFAGGKKNCSGDRKKVASTDTIRRKRSERLASRARSATASASRKLTPKFKAPIIAMPAAAA